MSDQSAKPVKVPPENALVWVCGKFPGRIHKRTDGLCLFRSGVPRFQANRFFKIQDILWEESRSRWYTMDPNAKPIAGTNPLDPGNIRNVTLLERENAEKLIREGHKIRDLAQSLNISEKILTSIKAQIEREFWEGK